MTTSITECKFDGAIIVGSGPLGCTYARMLTHPPSRIKGQNKPAIPVVMIDIGAQLSRNPGEHLKNTVYFQRDVNKFTGVISGHLQQTSVALDTSVVPTLDPDAFSYDPDEYKKFVQHGQNPKQKSYYNLPAQASTYAVGGMATHWTACTPREHPDIERFKLYPNSTNDDDNEWDRLYTKAEEFVHTRNNVFDSSIRHNIVLGELKKAFPELANTDYPPQSLPLGVTAPSKENKYVTWTGCDTILQPIRSQDSQLLGIFRLYPEWQATNLGSSAQIDGKPGQSIDYIEIENLRNGKKYRVYARIFIVACNATLTPQLLYKSGIRPQALGKYICEQPLAFCQIVLKRDLVPKRDPNGDENDPIGIPMTDPPPQCWIPVSKNRQWHCQIHRDAFSYGGIAPNVDTRLIVDLRWFGRVTPNEDNTLTFSDGEEDKNVDMFDMPQPTFCIKSNAADAKRNHEMMADMLRAANALGGFLPGSNPAFTEPGLALHLTGSTRMGHKNDGKSVVDTSCQVWGINNLYIGSCGVIPTGTACNPTLTAMALAIRGTEDIVDNWPNKFPFAARRNDLPPFDADNTPIY